MQEINDRNVLADNTSNDAMSESVSEETPVDRSVISDTSDTADSKESVDPSLHSRTFGTVYTPSAGVDGDGKSYSYTSYAVDSESDERMKKLTAEKAKKKKPRVGKWIAIVAVALLICVMFSGCVGGTLLMGYLINVQGDVTDSTTEIPSDSLTGTPGNIYIDPDDGSSENVPTIEVDKNELMTLEQAVGAVKDSVVEITTESVMNGSGGFSQYVVSGAGSGVIISSGGYIITNNHVIEGANNITVRLTDGKEFTAVLIGADSKTDIAVIAITPGDDVELTAAVIGNSDSLALAQSVFAIGNPLGELGGTVTNGIISALEREVAIEGSGKMTLLQTNAAVSPGNSGGGLFDLYGRLIGIVNAKSSGNGIEGISFAIPSNTAWNIAQQLINEGYVSGRPDLGVAIYQQEYGFGYFGSSYYYVYVSKIHEGSNFKVNDRIVSIDEKEISSMSDISDILALHEVGDVVNVIVVRDRKYVSLEVTLVEYVPEIFT